MQKCGVMYKGKRVENLSLGSEIIHREPQIVIVRLPALTRSSTVITSSVVTTPTAMIKSPSFELVLFFKVI